MKRFLSLMLLMAVTACVSMAQVFDTNSSSRYRIPAIVKDNNGSLVAFSDYRYGTGDIGTGRIDIYGKISTDNGATWGNSFTALSGSNTTGFTRAHGDAAVVCDRESGKMLMMCASGSIGYSDSKIKINRQGRGSWFSPYTYSLNVNEAIRVGRSYSEDNGKTWTTSVDKTSDVYGIWDVANATSYNDGENFVVPVTGLFFTSGKICQSSKIKVGDYYRIYAALCTNVGSLVVYSDDFGETWNALGGTSARPAPNGDEAKIEELPNGNVLLCCCVNGNTGRDFNIFTYTDQRTAAGIWGSVVRSGQTSVAGETYAASCNGDIMIVPAKRDGKDIYVALLSAAMSSEREYVGIYWKELSAESDYDTPLDFKTGWTAFPVSTTSSCYSSMTLDNNGNIALLYEETLLNYGYDIVFKTFALEDITGYKYNDPWVGKVLTIKVLSYDADEKVDQQRYLFNNDLNLAVNAEEEATTPTYNHYWVVSKDPGTNTYYLSSLNGDGYMGRANAIDYSTGEKKENIPACTDDYKKEFEIQDFVKTWTLTSNKTGVAMSGYALKFAYDSDKSRVVAIADDGEINWFDHTAKREAITNNGVTKYWSTDFELKEVEYTNTIGDYGTFDKPTYFGFPVKFERSDDGKAVYQGEDYNFYATLKLPFAVTLPDDVKAYKCTSLSDVEGTQVGLEELELKDNVLPRETPVLLSMSGKEGDVKTEKTIYLRPALAQTMQETGFAGTLGKKTFSDTEYNPETNSNIYILSKKNGHVAFYWLSDRTMAANKAYYVFEGTATNQSLVFNFGVTTAVDKITVSDAVKGNEPVYDLCGRRVAAPVKGIYIRGNRKVVVR